MNAFAESIFQQAQEITAAHTAIAQAERLAAERRYAPLVRVSWRLVAYLEAKAKDADSDGNMAGIAAELRRALEGAKL